MNWVSLRSLTKFLSKLLTTTCRGNDAFTMKSLFMRCNCKPHASDDFLAAYEVFVTLPIFRLKKNSRTELTVVLAENSIIATSAVVEKTRGRKTVMMSNGGYTASPDDEGFG